ncbi:MAG TPA: sugar phosphate isomerase/epimerase family protein [Terriglobales bacterium]|nr:sugar phosphate isomerase/epimerase family protein [Terriglobales bacterium]
MSTFAYIRERLHPGLLEGLTRAGAEAIEIFAFRGHFDYAQRRQHVLEIAGWFRDSGAQLNSVHSPFYNSYDWGRRDVAPLNIAEKDRKGRIEAMDEIKRAIEVAEHVPYRYLVQHVGISNEEFDERKFEAAMTSIEHLRAFAKPLGVKVLLENIPNELSTPERLVELLQTSHFDDVGVCFDVGHAHIMGDVESAFTILKHYIRSTHVHDNKKDKDAHLWPGEGNIDWAETMKLLGSAPNAPPLLLEIEGEGKTQNQVISGMSEAFNRLEQAVSAGA